MTAADLETFDALYRSEFPVVCRTVRRHVSADHATVEDLAQETFLRAMRAWPALPDKTRPRAWLCRIATNAAIDWRRRSQCAAALPLRLYAPEEDEGHDRADDRSLLASLVRTMNPSQVRLVHAIYVEQRLRSDIARELGVPEGTVASRTHKAMGRARKRIPMATQA